MDSTKLDNVLLDSNDKEFIINCPKLKDSIFYCFSNKVSEKIDQDILSNDGYLYATIVIFSLKKRFISYVFTS